MDNLLYHYVDKILLFEKAGYIKQALCLADKLLEAFPNERESILLERAKLKFRNNYEEEALFDFVAAYEIAWDKEIYELVMEAYYLPNKEQLDKTYLTNVEYLEKYPHYRNLNKNISVSVVPVWINEKLILYADIVERRFQIYKRNEKDISEEKGQTLMLVNELWMEDIIRCEKCFQCEYRILDMELPVYLVFDRKYWELFIKLYDIGVLLDKNRIVFLVGKEALSMYLLEDMVIFPSKCFYNDFQEEYEIILQEAWEVCEREKEKFVTDIESYYENNVEELLLRIKAQKPRIMFITSRYTTALQYHIRDCMEAAQKNGCATELLIEPDGIHRVTDRQELKRLFSFKPDVIFLIDHFRYEHSMNLLKEVIVVTWIQDDLPYILDPKTPLKLTEKDFIMNHFTTWEEIRNVGYPVERTMDAPIAANDSLYKPYQLTKEEKEKYEADICMVCHAADAEEYMEGYLAEIRDAPGKVIVRNMLQEYSDLVMSGEGILYKREEVAQYIEQYFLRFYNLKFPANLLNDFTQRMMEFSQRVFRQAIVDWLIDAGYENIKLWGNGWLKSPKYRKYAMGAAENGEVLSKILQSTKIVLGNNFNATGAARAWETMLSGAFYMSNYVPPEADVVDIRKVLKENENLIMFYDKDDLLAKVGYYLEHDAERKQMAEKGRKAALETMTYDAFMKKMLMFLKEYFETVE